jgi:hypothetical protein
LLSPNTAFKHPKNIKTKDLSLPVKQCTFDRKPGRRHTEEIEMLVYLLIVVLDIRINEH